ncbi:MAG: hypothetical protein BWZ07_01701 [Alphaproteobacteria bacterium ADurb.BinA280]|jgi:uncharacterized protein YndB with AHSA1/START domain|nr:SRPBCC domain-containing protein [Xanthomonadales bacterium]MCC6506158.1 SRPBCC domain-containing protein [Aquimonas sp.]OPZ11893.1 MAG: hypothetical protein BWZ07_01701 [Alphaproteobacteria bacterium ADurb.BinA280]
MRSWWRLTWGLMVASGLAAQSISRAEVLDQNAAGFTLQQQIVVPVSSERAWEALVNDVGLWWPSDHTWWGDARKLSIEPLANGCFCERDGQRQAAHMRVVFVDPPTTLRLVGGLGPLQGMGMDGVLEFSLQAQGEQSTAVRMRYRAGGYVSEDLSQLVPVVDQVQGLQLGGLKKYLMPTEATP